MSPHAPAAGRETCRALLDAGLERGHLGLEKMSTFLPDGVAEHLVVGMPEASWHDVPVGHRRRDGCEFPTTVGPGLLVR